MQKWQTFPENFPSLYLIQPPLLFPDFPSSDEKSMSSRRQQRRKNNDVAEKWKEKRPFSFFSFFAGKEREERGHSKKKPCPQTLPGWGFADSVPVLPSCLWKNRTLWWKPRPYSKGENTRISRKIAKKGSGIIDRMRRWRKEEEKEGENFSFLPFPILWPMYFAPSPCYVSEGIAKAFLFLFFVGM